MEREFEFLDHKQIQLLEIIYISYFCKINNFELINY